MPFLSLSDMSDGISEQRERERGEIVREREGGRGERLRERERE